jgi:tRNA A-37 threonylcarbamoyl transferase component Bud32
MQRDTASVNRAGFLPDELSKWPAYDEILKNAKILRKATSWGNSDTYVLRSVSGKQYLLKSFVRQPWLARIILGRLSIKNEYRLLRHLEKQGFQQAPKALAMLNEDCLLMQYFAEGKNLRKKERYSADKSPGPDFFHALVKLLRQLHGMGICHGDFRRANILRMPDDRPILLDWSTAMIKSASLRSTLMRPLYNALRRSDLFSLATIVASYDENLLDDDMRYCLQHQPWYLKAARCLRQSFYRHFIKKIRKKIRQAQKKKQQRRAKPQ